MKCAIEAVYAFAHEAFLTVGVADEVAELTARGLCHASLRGVDSHGIRLLPHYIAALKGGRINPRPAFCFEKTSPSMGLLDGDHTFGYASGLIAMRHAMGLAEQAGSGHVVVKNSSHCGAMSYYALEACKQDMIGLALTHATSRLMSPGSNRPFFGNNPICLAAPMLNEPPFCFDAALTPFSFNKVRQYNEENRMLPPRVCADQYGHPTQDPKKAEQLLPIGSYKGFGLSMVVDILCGLLTGMPVGRSISNMYNDPLSKKRYLGHFFLALRIDDFVDPEDFKDRLQGLADDVRREPRLNPEVPVLVPGDPEKAHEEERRREGIPISPVDMERLHALARDLGIRPLGGQSA